jgi:transcriptional regulator with XRE-family HTH domain
MWLDRLKELKEQQNLSNKQIAEKMLVSERTINRIFNGENDHPYIDHIDKIAKVLGTTLGDVFAEAKAVVATETVAVLQENVEAVTAEKELVVAEKELSDAENNVLKDKVAALTAEVELLKMQLKHKDEIIALHNYYNKLKTTEQ